MISPSSPKSSYSFPASEPLYFERFFELIAEETEVLCRAILAYSERMIGGIIGVFGAEVI